MRDPPEGFHAKTLLREVCVYVATVPNQPPLSHAVERDAKREDAAEGGRLAGDHRAQGDTLGYRRRDKIRVVPHRTLVGQSHSRWHTLLRGPFSAIPAIKDG